MTNKEIIKKANEINSELRAFLFSMDSETIRCLKEAMENNFKIVIKNEKKIVDYETKYWDIFNKLLQINSKAFVYSSNKEFPVATCLFEKYGYSNTNNMKDFLKRIVPFF